MATKEVITHDCDNCQSETEVESHVLRIDGKTVEVDGCATCWAKFRKVAQAWLDAGRPVARTARKPRRTAPPV